MSSHTALYTKFAATLWLEDEESRVYVDGIWGPSQHLQLLVAAGSESVQALVAAARQAGSSFVWGLQDRDFRPPRAISWAGDFSFRAPSVVQPSPRPVECLPIHHELENLLLDPEALTAAAIALGARPGSAATVERDLIADATAQIPWNACRSVLAELRRAEAPFPSHPKGPPLRGTQAARNAVTTVDDAIAYILSSSWWMAKVPRVSTPLAARMAVKTRVEAEIARYTASLSAAGAVVDRLADFSGKELFEASRQRLQLGTLEKVDVVRAIAAEQVRLQRVDPTLAGLAAFR